MDLRERLFKLRSYTPLPFLIVMLLFAAPTVTTLVAGLAITVLGEAIRFWGVAIAGTETRTTGEPGATNLITDGPFGYVRNPLYVGNILMYTGFGVMSNALMPWLPIVALAYFVFQYAMIISREEQHLRQAFGDEYVRYVENVPRFVPRFTQYKGEHSFHRGVDFKRGFTSETRTLQAFGTLLVILVIKFWLAHRTL
jgi:protein-S-isoprenylcysteine O-methyltransferase Ste14